MTPETLLHVLQTTWPAAETLSCGPFVLRRSNGGGQRVTAASLRGADTADQTDIVQAETRMQRWGQPCLFSLLPGHSHLDVLLEARGYLRRDPTELMCGPLTPLLKIETPRLSTFEVSPPLAIMAEIWANGGVGPDRLDVMARSACASTTLLARQDNQPAGVVYVAALDGIAMVHALEVDPPHRRKGVAQRLMGRAAQWGEANGCDTMSLAVTEANVAAKALYRSLGMTFAGRYHYRRHPDHL